MKEKYWLADVGADLVWKKNIVGWLQPNE